MNFLQEAGTNTYPCSKATVLDQRDNSLVQIQVGKLVNVLGSLLTGAWVTLHYTPEMSHPAWAMPFP